MQSVYIFVYHVAVACASSWSDMALSLGREHLCVALMVLCVTCSSFSKAQDPLLDFANAAICFDNHAMMNNCLLSMGINISSTAKNLTIAPPPAPMNSTDTFCNSPCYDLMMLIVSCIDGLFTNFQFYTPGLMQGVESIFEMACSGNNSTNSSNSNSSSSSQRASSLVAPTGDFTNSSNIGKRFVSWSSCIAPWMIMLLACFLFCV